jgi:hypothetical protein
LQLQRGDISTPWLPALSEAVAASLTSLVLQKTVSHRYVGRISQHSEQFLQKVRGLTGLHHLSLTFNGTFGTSIPYLQVLQAVSGLQHLTFLQFRGGDPSHESQPQLPQQQQQCLAQLTGLQQLNLQTCSMAGFEHLQSLTGLSLKGNRLHSPLSVDGTGIAAVSGVSQTCAVWS